MAALIGALRATLSADTAKFEQGMRRAQRSASTAESGIKRSLDSINGTVRAGLAGVASGLSVGLFTQAARNALDYAGSLGEVSQQLGVTTRDLQAFRYIGGQAGVSQEELDKALGKLTVTLGQVRAGAEGPLKAFKAIGISMDDLKGKDTGEVFRMIADGLSRVQDRSQRAAVEVALFGRAGAKLDTVLAGGSAEINRLADAAQKLGVVLSEEQIVKADETADKLDALQTVLKAKIAGAVADNADSILALADSLVELISALGRAGRAWTNYTDRVAYEVIQLKKLNPFADQAAIANQEAQIRQRLGVGSSQVTVPLGPVIPYRPRTPPGEDINPFLASEGSSREKTRTQKDGYNAFVQELRREGIRITSGFRSFEEQARLYRSLPKGQAARPGTSDHEFHKAVDIPAGADPVKVARAASRAGVTLGKRIDHQGTGFHGHQPFSVGRSEGGGEAELAEAARDALQERLDRLRAANTHAQEQAQAELDILGAQRDLATDYVERNSLSLQMLERSREAERAETAYQVELHKLSNGAEGISAAQAEQKNKQRDIVYALEVQRVLQEEQVERAQEVARLDEIDFDIRRQALEGEAALAETAAEQRDVQLRILELVYQQEKARLMALEADQTIGWAAREEAGRRLAALDQQYQQQQQGVIQGTRGPMEGYMASLPDTAAKWQEALEGVRVNGLQALEDGLVGVISGTQSVADAFSDMTRQILADLVRIMIQKAITFAISSAMGGGGGFNAGASMASGAGVLGALNAMPLPGFATGGGFSIMGNRGRDRNLLQLNGLPIARVSHGERISVDNDNGPAAMGGTFHFNNYARMSPDEARRTGRQAAVAYKNEIARASREGY